METQQPITISFYYKNWIGGSNEVSISQMSSYYPDPDSGCAVNVVSNIGDLVEDVDVWHRHEITFTPYYAQTMLPPIGTCEYCNGTDQCDNVPTDKDITLTFSVKFGNNALGSGNTWTCGAYCPTVTMFQINEGYNTYF